LGKSQAERNKCRQQRSLEYANPLKGVAQTQ
jgi:hypothetical protein